MTRTSLVLLLVLIVPAACISRDRVEKQRHVLAVERADAGPGGAGAAAVAGVAGVLRVDRVRVAEMFERKGFVYRTGDTTYEEDFYNEFFLQPGTFLLRAAEDWLEQGGRFDDVVGGNDRGRPDWILEAWVPELYGDLRGGGTAAVLALEFTVLDARSPRHELAFRRRYDARRPVPGRSAAAILAGWTEGLAGVLAELEADLAAELPVTVAAAD